MKGEKSKTAEEPVALPTMRAPWVRVAALAVLAALIVYLCFRMALPFLPALCWAFALALLAHPVYGWLNRSVHRNLSALITVFLVAVLIIGPAILLARALVQEGADAVTRLTNESSSGSLRAAFENNRIIGRALRRLDSEIDLPDAALQAARALAGWASSRVSSILTGSVWLLTQIGTMLFVLFYFLRDGHAIAERLRSVVPLPPRESAWLFARIAQTIRVSLGGKAIMAAIQGTLGGIMFYWLSLPAPVFWGFAMAVLSIFPMVGSFLIWGPVAITFAVQGDWRHALMLTGWGVLIINPVDNLLGPLLIGSTLRLHTLLMFFSILGGIAAFGAAGVVLGPITIALAAGLVELADRRRDRSSER